jgi:Ion channel
LLTVLATVAGAVLILIALRDVFDVLFNEAGKAVLAHGVTRTVWRAFRVIGRRNRRLFSLAGPFSLLAVIGTWVVILILGWALIFLPHMHEAFTIGSGVPERHEVIDSLYLSLTTLATLGFGDITPEAATLRLFAPIEALLGLGLLTASISWLLSIYPVLNRRRSLAYEVHLLVGAERKLDADVLELGGEVPEEMLAELTTRLVGVERDMATFPIAYYFATADERFSLPAVMPALLDLADRGIADGQPDRIRLRATMLHEAIDDFAKALQNFHGGDDGSTAELIEAYRRDHLR